MNSVPRLQYGEPITNVLEYARNRGIRISVRNGQVHYRAAKQVLARANQGAFRAYSDRVVALAKETGQPFDQTPLGLSQIVHWNSSQLWEQYSFRMVSSVLHLRGHLHVEHLRDSITEVVRRHEALRTRIVVVNGWPMQQIDYSVGSALRFHDMSDMPEHARKDQCNASIEKFLLEPVDVSADPLCAFWLGKFRWDEHILVLALEHVISDAFSMGVLLRDLFAVYANKVRGEVSTLTPVVQFGDYAVWQAGTLQSWTERHHPYWKRHLEGCERTRVTTGPRLPDQPHTGWGAVTFTMGKDLASDLREWCRSKRTTLVMGVFTAYVALLLRWCRVSEVVVRYQTDGRARPEVENTIGYFASRLYLRVSLLEGDRFTDLLERITEEFCNAHEHADYSYVETQVPSPGYVRNGFFNWIPRPSNFDLPLLESSPDALSVSPVQLIHPFIKLCDWDGEPCVVFEDSGDDIVGIVEFPQKRFSTNVMEQFGRNLLAFVRSLLSEPERRIGSISIVR